MSLNMYPNIKSAMGGMFYGLYSYSGIGQKKYQQLRPLNDTV